MHVLTLLYMLVIQYDITHQQDAPEGYTAMGTPAEKPCTTDLFCIGYRMGISSLIKTVQESKIFPDSKIFVDMIQIHEPNVTLQNFDDMMSKAQNEPTSGAIKSFIKKNFVDYDELDMWTPSDFNESPAFLKRIRDFSLNNFARILVSYWKTLGRKVSDHVKQFPNQHSIFPLPEPFILPGENFEEMCYWDNYWIIQGLLVCEMKDTVKSILTNLAYLVKEYEYIPKCSRKYYYERSNPPLFAAMMELYMNYTDDIRWLRENVNALESELAWWKEERSENVSVNGVSYQMYIYGGTVSTPRTESYMEDVFTCSEINNGVKQRKCYQGLRSATESGWDFSSRWIIDDNGVQYTDMDRVIPVDENAFMCQSYRLLSRFYGKLGDYEKESKFAEEANVLRTNIEAVFYSTEDGIWYDYDRVLNKERKLFFASNFAPLWADCYDLDRKEEYGRRAAEYYNNRDVDKYWGGIPASLETSHEKWDFPNVWAPMQELVATGLRKTGNSDAIEIATKIGARWIVSTIKGFSNSQGMYAKYDANTPGKFQSADISPIEAGYAWSVGVTLTFLKEYASSARISKSMLNPISYVAVFTLLTVIE